MANAHMLMCTCQCAHANVHTIESPFSQDEKGLQCTDHLSSSRKTSAGIGTMGGSLAGHTNPDALPGCRGFTGPVPPPLWIRVSPEYSIVGR